MSESLHLVGLEARNVMRVRAVRLEFGERGELVVIGGKNEQGKSSVLRAIEMALAGAGAVPTEALRKGASKGSARVILRDSEGRGYDVERVVTKDGTRLVVTDADGDTMRSPQALLDGLRGALAFDPLEFARLAASGRADDRAKAAKVLRELLGLDLSEFDRARAEALDERRDAGRDVATLEAQLAGLTLYRGAPAEEESAAALTAELESANAEIARRAVVSQGAIDAREAVNESQREEARAVAAVEEARAVLARAEKWLADQRETTARLLIVAEEATEIAAEATATPLPDVEAIRARISTLDERNAQVRANRAHAAKAKELAEARERHERAEQAIDEIEEARRAKFAAAEWPIDGLGFDDEGLVRLNGLPFEQASQAEQIRTSLAIGMALNPKLRLILVREGSALDEDALRMVSEMAAAKDVTVLLERVGKGEEVQVVIEDGAVAEDRREETTA